MLNIYEQSTTEKCTNRINKLTPETKALWGKMNVAQMLAHCNVSYDMAYGITRSNNSGFAKFMIKLFVKKIVTNETPYKKGGRTAPQFVIAEEREFEIEKQKLIKYINDTQQKGASYFEGKESDSFGKLTASEWNNMFYKHLDHHLKQFGV